MAVFKSLVIMDIESSGLPSCGKIKITELSLVGVLVNHIHESNKVCENTPRVLQKLNICFYPQKCIDFEATEITGLDNFLLEEIPAFNKEACELLRSFLGRMPSPVCLVAHNGMKFDFPLLKAELLLKNEALPEDILCADSLLAFRALFPIAHGSYSPAPSSSHSPIGVHGVSPLDVVPIHTSPPRNCSQVGSFGEHPDGVDRTKIAIAEYFSSSNMEKINNTTPKTIKRLESAPPLKRKNDENAEYKSGFVRKKLFNGQKKLNSHKLGDLYHYFLGKDQDSGHRAESDTVALLECIVSTAPKFLPWISKNHIKFTKNSMYVVKIHLK